MNDVVLKPRRPYLLRAFYDWLLDNEFTPHMLVDATLPLVNVPLEYVQDGKIVLNIAPQAIADLELGKDEVRFNARFGGQLMTIVVPLYAVLAIYARENGAGTMFESEPAYDAELENIESNSAEAPVLVDDGTKAAPEDSDANEQDEDSSNKRPKGRPTLTVIK